MQQVLASPRLDWRDRPLQSLKTTCELIGVSRPTLYKLAAEGKLTFKRLGERRTMVDTASIIAHLSSAQDWVPAPTPTARRARSGGAA